MSLDRFSCWQKLRLSQPISWDERPYLVKYHFTSSAYSVSVTNLIDVWSESLQRRDIVRRALVDDASIDPSEDLDQLPILLDQIKRGICGTVGTSQILSKSDDHIHLKIVAQLPAPLEPLRWTLDLSKAPRKAVEQEIVLPLLSDHIEQMRKSDILLKEIRDKDHVLEKLLDKLCSSGTEIGSVFPAAAGLKFHQQGTSREKLGGLVQGLGPFDVEGWSSIDRRPEVDRNLVGKSRSETLLNVYYDIQNCGVSSDASLPALIDPDPTVNEEAEFQVQATPLHVREVSRRCLDSFSGRISSSEPPCAENRESIPHFQDDLDTTEDEAEEGDSQNPMKPHAVSGAIAASDRALPTNYSQLTGPIKRAVPTSPKFHQIRTTIEQAKIPDDQGQIAPDTSSNPPKPTNIRLGKIGGHRPSPGLVPDSRSNSTAVPTHKAVLGQIGGQRQVHSPQDEIDRPKSSRSKSPLHKADPTSPPNTRDVQATIPEATPQQRADRKRADLKRELEEKAKAPAKKKKRF